MKKLIFTLMFVLGLAVANADAQGVVRNGGSGGGSTNVGAPETLADGMSNPSSAGKVQAYMFCWNGTTWDRCLSEAAPGGGATTKFVTSAATTNSTSVKATAGTLFDIAVINTTATIYYLRLYNSTAAPTCSSATDFIESIPVPASTTGAGVVRSSAVGRAYTQGIGFCLTAGGSSTDNNAAATGVYISLGYK